MASRSVPLFGGPPWGLRIAISSDGILLVTQVSRNGRAHKEGIRVGDVVESLNGQTCLTSTDLRRIMRTAQGTLTLTISSSVDSEEPQVSHVALPRGLPPLPTKHLTTHKENEKNEQNMTIRSRDERFADLATPTVLEKENYVSSSSAQPRHSQRPLHQVSSPSAYSSSHLSFPAQPLFNNNGAYNGGLRGSAMDKKRYFELIAEKEQNKSTPITAGIGHFLSRKLLLDNVEALSNDQTTVISGYDSVGGDFTAALAQSATTPETETSRHTPTSCDLTDDEYANDRISGAHRSYCQVHSPAEELVVGVDLHQPYAPYSNDEYQRINQYSATLSYIPPPPPYPPPLTKHIRGSAASDHLQPFQNTSVTAAGNGRLECNKQSTMLTTIETPRVEIAPTLSGIKNDMKWTMRMDKSSNDQPAEGTVEVPERQSVASLRQQIASKLEVKSPNASATTASPTMAFDAVPTPDDAQQRSRLNAVTHVPGQYPPVAFDEIVPHPTSSVYLDQRSTDVTSSLVKTNDTAAAALECPNGVQPSSVPFMRMAAADRTQMIVHEPMQRHTTCITPVSFSRPTISMTSPTPISENSPLSWNNHETTTKISGCVSTAVVPPPSISTNKTIPTSESLLLATSTPVPFPSLVSVPLTSKEQNDRNEHRSERGWQMSLFDGVKVSPEEPQKRETTTVAGATTTTTTTTTTTKPTFHRALVDSLSFPSSEMKTGLRQSPTRITNGSSSVIGPPSSTTMTSPTRQLFSPPQLDALINDQQKRPEQTSVNERSIHCDPQKLRTIPNSKLADFSSIGPQMPAFSSPYKPLSERKIEESQVESSASHAHRVSPLDDTRGIRAASNRMQAQQHNDTLVNQQNRVVSPKSSKSEVHSSTATMLGPESSLWYREMFKKMHKLDNQDQSILKYQMRDYRSPTPTYHPISRAWTPSPRVEYRSESRNQYDYHPRRSKSVGRYAESPVNDSDIVNRWRDERLRLVSSSTPRSVSTVAQRIASERPSTAITANRNGTLSRDLADLKRLSKEEILNRQKLEKLTEELEQQRNRRHGYVPSASPSLQRNFERLNGLLNEFGREERSTTPKLAAAPTLAICTALYSFRAQNARELPLNKGDVVRVIREVDANWMEGERNGRTGIFPSSYVQMEENLPTQQVRFVAKFPFYARNNNEISFKKGDILQFRRIIDTNWLEGVNNHGEIGIFPKSYVQEVEENGRASVMTESDAPDRPKTPKIFSSFPHREELPTRVKKMDHGEELLAWQKRHINDGLSGPAHIVPKNAETYRAIYPYHPENPDELELRENDIVFVVEKCDDGWFIGTLLRTGQFGTFPGNYVQRH